MPLSERDYMRRPPPSRGPWERGRFNLDPIWVIIGINVMVFLVAFVLDRLSPFAGDLLAGLFGLSPIDFLQHPWTIVTSMFTHVEIWHIFSNMITFYFFGTFLIALVGESRFLLTYLGGGLLGGIFYIAITFLGQFLSLRILGSPYSTVIGASGAVYALGGALAVLRPQQKVLLYFLVPIPLWLAVIGGFLIIWQGVAWQAHLGGLAFGLIAGYLFKRRGRYYF